MADQEQSTRPVARVLRESFISFFQRDGQEASLRLLDDLAYTFVCESRSDNITADDNEAITRSDVLSAAGDLRQAADQLKESRQSLVEACSDDPEVLRVVVAIADACEVVRPLADQLDAALARYLAAGRSA